MAKELVTATCPRCSQSTSTNISEVFLKNRSSEIEWRCACGYRFKYNLERRRHNRKKVKLSGWYNYSNEVRLAPGIVAGKFVGKGKMTVLDLSVSGLKVKLRKKEDLKINDRFQVEFHLNDAYRTLVRETATIKTIHKKTIGGVFQPSKSQNRELGFYLLS